MKAGKYILTAAAAALLALAAPSVLAQEPPPPPPAQNDFDVRPRWERPGAGQRPLVRLFQRVAQLPLEEQERALQENDLFQLLAPEMQRRFRQRLAEFNRLPPEQRRHMAALWGAQQEHRRTAEALFLRVAPLTPQEQEQALAGDEFFQSLPPHVQARFRRRLGEFNAEPPELREHKLDRLRRFNDLPPEAQERIRRRAEIFEQMSPEQRQQAEELFQSWRELAPERRQLLMDRLRRLDAATPEERRALVEGEEFTRPLRENERRMLRQLFEFRRLLPPPGGPGRGGPPRR